MEPFYIRTTDGLQLSGKCRTPETQIRGVILLIHGLGEHLGRYDHVAQILEKAGFAVVGTDLRGHGNSEGRRGHVPAFEHLLDDLFQTLKKTRIAFPGLPVFLYGHSLGGLIVLDFALQKNMPDPDGIISSAPALRICAAPPAWKLGMVKLLDKLKLYPAVSSGLDDRLLSKDLNVIRAYRNDPLTHDRITPALALGMMESGKKCLKHAAELAVPALLFHGSDDRITDPAATRQFAETAGGNCTFKMLSGILHEPHNAPVKKQVFELVLNWLNDRL
ncbi:alpha/beta hydrolase [Verrucomicrobia bacterium S94]|nr:alpha/beta hydrolase [Verrucomicrobia bacterium S94]